MDKGREAVLYTEKELVRIARRENNSKRTYLIVNCLQAKHIPAEPGRTLSMFDELADLLAGIYQDEKLLLVGFAETATAIGSRLAIRLNSYYMQTTREQIEGVEYFYFTESHSHAMEQKLVKTDLDQIITKTDRIVFVEDEITTGNTIMKIIHMIKDEYPRKIGFSVASLLNGMDEEAQQAYQENGILMHYLVKTDHSSYADVADQVCGDGAYVADLQECSMSKIRQIPAAGYVNARRLVRGEDYGKACRELWEQIKKEAVIAAKETVLVLGTEEFMYPAIHIADQLAQAGCLVKCHATTRSPIMVSKERSYPLHCRYELRSLYDPDRKTYVYDIGCYDRVFVITDAAEGAEAGIADLCSAITAGGNTQINIVRWCGE